MNSPFCNYPPPTFRWLRGAALGTCYFGVYNVLSLNGFDEFRYFASGTGAAGLVGAFLWWELRNLGVRVGVGLSSVKAFQLVVVLF